MPVSTDPCGRLQYGIPNNNTEHQVLGKVDYTLSQNQTRSWRGTCTRVYDNPATYDGKNVLTLSRTGAEQPGRTRSSSATTGSCRPSAVNALHVTYNKTINDRPLPEYFTPTDLGITVYSPPCPATWASASRTAFTIGSGGTNPGYFNSNGWQIADDFDCIRGKHQLSVGGNWIQHEHRDREQPADQRRVHVQRSDTGPRPGRLHDRAA